MMAGLYEAYPLILSVMTFAISWGTTKAEISAQKADIRELKNGLVLMKDALDKEIARTKADFDKDISNVKIAFDKELGEHKLNMSSEVGKIHAKLERLYEEQSKILSCISEFSAKMEFLTNQFK